MNAGATIEVCWDIFDDCSEEFADVVGWGRWMHDSPFYTERWARHNLRDSSINFLSAPWSLIGHLYRSDIENEAVIRRCRRKLMSLDLRALAESIAHRPNVTVLHLEKVSLMLIAQLRRFGVKSVFMPGGSEWDRTWLRSHGIAALPFPYITPRPPPAPQTKDILFSFIGGESEVGGGIRLLIRDRFAGDPNVVVRPSHHWGGSTQRSEQSDRSEADYDRTLARSRFALCPAGSSPQTVRFYEALSAGAIPIVIAEGWTAPPWDWANTCMIVSPKTFETLTRAPGNFIEYLSAHETREETMRRNCGLAWGRFQPAALRQLVVETLAEHESTAVGRPDPTAKANEELRAAAAAESFAAIHFRAVMVVGPSEPEVIALEPERADRLFAILQRSKNIPAACSAVDVDRGYWDSLVNSHPCFRERAIAIVGRTNLRKWS